MRRSWYAAVAVCTLLLAACEDGTGPDLPASRIDFVLDADFARTDTSVVVDGTDLLRFPAIDRSVRAYRYLHYGFGGFPELGYELADRMIDFRGIVLAHQDAPLLRNDSTILRYVDHGFVSVEGVELQKETSIPIVPAGADTAYENYVAYSIETFARIVWVEGDTTDFAHVEFHDRMVEGAAVELVSTGSAMAHPAGDSLVLGVVSTLTGMANGDTVSFDVAEAPELSAGEDLVLHFDRALDPERAFIRIAPFTVTAGARSVVIQPREAARRVVVPASLLETLVEDASEARVPFYLMIEEYAVEDDAFTGTRPNGGEFSLPFVHASETVLHVWLER